MLPRDNRSPAVPTELLDNPPRTFVRREMASDGDITRPHNPIPPLSVPAGNPSQWHIHLEVRPEQLVALHRLGFTSGALAWRHGMARWQPLRDGNDGDSLADADAEWSDDEHDASGTRELNDDGRSEPARPKAESRRAFAFPRGGAGAAVGLVQATPVSTRPPPPSHDEVLDEMLARPLPPPPRLPGSVPPRASDEASYEPSAHPPLYDDAGYHSPAPLALVPRPAWLARTHPTPVALERPISIPPPAILDNYGGQRAVVGVRTLWLGMGATVVVSAAIAALVSSLVWNLHARSDKSEQLAENAASAALEPMKPADTKPAHEAAEPQPKSVSVDQLPLLSGTRTAAPVTITGSEAARSEPREAPRPAAESHAAPPRWTPPKPAPTPSPAPAAPAAKQAPSGIEASIAARLAEESAPKPAEPEEAPAPAAPPGPADRGGVARAVAQAAAAAKSCSTSPENGQILVKFAPSGSAQSIQLLKPFSSRDVNACVLRAMSRARVNAFTGEPVSVRKTLRW